MSKGAPNVRYAEIDRETRHTKIHLVIDLEGGTRRDVSTGIATFDELLTEMARYASLDFGVSVEADVAVDDHYVIEDVGAAFGRAVRVALQDSDPSVGTGHSVLPAGDALVLCAVDVNGRPFLGWDVPFRRDWIGAMATENVQEFFRAFTDSGSFSLHIRKLAGDNDVHVCEAIFRAFGRCLYTATRRAERYNGPGK
jgi:imidazoleglycerol-phosphate dehydratase